MRGPGNEGGLTMVAHEPAYEQLTLSVRENWLVVDSGVETPGAKGRARVAVMSATKGVGCKK